MQLTAPGRVRPRVAHVRAIVVACLLAIVPATARAQQAPKPFEAMSASASSLRDSLVALARAQIGRRYVRGGTTPERGFDCSGLVKYIMAAFDRSVPRTANQQARVGLAIVKDTSRLRPGDLLTFGKGKRGVSHIGIYVGNGRFIHASTKAGRVIESPLVRPMARGIKPWLGVRRLFTSDDDTAQVQTASVKSGG